MKFALIGFVAGLFVAIAAYKIAERRERPAIEAAQQKLVNAAAAAEKTETSTRAELEQARAEIETIRAERRDPPPPPVQFEPPKRRSIKSLAADLAKFAPRLRGCTWDSWPKEARELQSQIMAEMHELARELGISVDEAMRSPDGLALLLVEVLDPAEQTRLRELLAAEKPAWDEWKAARANQSSLESRRKFLDVAGKTRDAFLGALTEDQRTQVKNFGVLDAQIQGSQTWIDGSGATVTQALATQWSSTLNLDAQQAHVVAPIVVDYIKLSRELNESIWARRRAGEDLSREKDYAMRLDLMIQTHRRIAEAAGLTSEQVQAMKEWQFTYGVNITDAAGD